MSWIANKKNIWAAIAAKSWSSSSAYWQVGVIMASWNYVVSSKYILNIIKKFRIWVFGFKK